MNKLWGRSGYVFLAKADDEYPHWYRVTEVDLLAEFDSPSDDVVPWYEDMNWSGSEESSQHVPWDLY